MVEVAKSLSLFSHNSSKYICNKLPQETQKRENKKRKSVHFDVDVTASTSDYLFQEGKQWNHIASFFNCEEKHGERHNHEPMDELLNLCDWHEKQERNPEINYENTYPDSDSDDEIPYAAFAMQQQHSIYPKPSISSQSSSSKISSSTRLSSLRLTSKLCLKSSRTLVVKQRSILRIKNRGSNDQVVASNKKNVLELAFQGIMASPPTDYDLVTERALSKETKASVEPGKSKKEEDDFWGNVEF